ncbi:PDZ and LIM domain protein 5-like isoform X2 [Lytechinus variegatus]|uniref:PDZ and LIM domain protein 5-like isoform X2 n=1 Tax=Lytechinus variegatus TaxID=7654 RepID=UPI001BB18058|nr:PDZ and LIM domain protein 5-like isoform X2 [Lytechinus variegatus]
MTQRVNIRIPGPSGPWGFRLAGGRDFNQPLFISKVTPGGKAHRANVLENDNILAINGCDMANVTHLDAQNFIKSNVGDLIFDIERSAQATIWTPEVNQQPDTGINVSLKANKQQFQHAGSSHNVKPRLFPGAGGGAAQPQSGPNMVHKQFNSPVGIYSAQNIADSYRGQTEGVASSNTYEDDQQAPPAWQKPSSYGAGSSQANRSRSFNLVQKLAAEDDRDYGGQPASAPAPAPAPAPAAAPGYRPSGTRSVRAPVAKPSSGGAQPANALPVCSKCGENIMGPFVKVRGKPLMPECFTCESCGTSLRNKGFFVINELLYCESCKNRIQRQPGQVNGSSVKSAPKSPSKAGPPKVANDEDHTYQNGTSSAVSYSTPPEPASYDTTPVNSDLSSDVASFPDPPSFLTEHAPVSSHSYNGTGDATDSGYSDHQSDDLPPPPSTMSTVLSTAPAPWNPNDSYTAPVIRSVRAPKGKSGRSPSPADSNSLHSVPEDGVKVMFVPKNHLGKPPSQVAGRTTTTTKTFTTSFQAPTNTITVEEDDMAAPPPPPPPPMGAGNYAWKANPPAAPRPSPPPAAYRPGPPPAPKGQPPRSVFPQPPPVMLNQRAQAAVAPPPSMLNQRAPPVAPPPAQRGPPVAPPPAQRGPPVAPPTAPKGPPVRAPQAPRAPPAPAPAPAAPRGGGMAPPSAPATAPGGMTRTPFCDSCNEQVRGSFVTAFGRNWHPEHFVCAHCHENLQGKGVIEDKGKIFCEDCYNRLYAPKCASCMGSITGECVKAMGAEYHPNCFTCVVCKQPITGDGFHMQDGMMYCKRDFQNKFRGVNCGSCNYPIEAGDAWLEALDKSYHADCFCCTQCNQRLEGQRFYAKGGRPYCQAHGS